MNTHAHTQGKREKILLKGGKFEEEVEIVVTSVFTMLRGSRLGKNFEINKTKGHKPQSEPRH